MRPLRATFLRKLMSSIVAATPLAIAAAACGGSIEGTSSGGAGDQSASGGQSSSGSSRGAGCGVPPKTFYVAFEPQRTCGDGGTSDEDAGDAETGISGDGGVPTLRCEETSEYCARVCKDPTASYIYGTSIESCAVKSDPANGKRIECRTYGKPCGRRHEGLAPLFRDSSASVGSYLAESAYVEDASVASFEILARELQAHGAPERLVRASRRSARDEARHTRVMTALARRHGVTTTRAKKPRRGVRGVEAMLVENAIEGCVGETYGALLAWYQATHATEPRIRAAMRRIAVDETRHAALAWEIAAWGEAKLDADGKEQLRDARARALRALASTLVEEPAREIANAVGLPSSAAALAMLSSLAEELGLEGPAIAHGKGHGDDASARRNSKRRVGSQG